MGELSVADLFRVIDSRGRAHSPTRDRGRGAAALLALAAFCGCDRGPASEVEPPIAVEVEAAQSVELTSPLVFPCVTRADARISLGFREGGRIAAFHVDRGDRVKAGQHLAELDKSDLERELRGAKARLRGAEARALSAERAAGRARKLAQSRAVPDEHLEEADLLRDIARSDLELARVDLEAAEWRLADADISAPVAGFIEERLFEAHEFAEPREPVLVLTSVEKLRVLCAATDGEIATMGVGMKARVRSPPFPDRYFEGHISLIRVAADPSTRTVPFEVEIANPDLALKPELSVTVELQPRSAGTAVTVPAAAVMRGSDDVPFLLVVEDDGEGKLAQRRQIELGRVLDGRVVARGVREGDLVIVRGQHFVQAESRVRVVEHH